MADMQPAQQTPAGRGQAAAWLDFVKGPAGIVAGIMTLLALVGTGITLADATWARTYWLVLVPIYGLLCVFAAWHRTRQFSGTVIRQVLHWISIGAAIALDLAYLRGSGEQTATATGLSSLLILALGCVLAGIHLEWLFALVGLLLLAIFIIAALAQQYLTTVFLAGIVVALTIGVAFWAMRKRASEGPTSSP